MPDASIEVRNTPAQHPAYRPIHPSSAVHHWWPSGGACQAHQHEHRAICCRSWVSKTISSSAKSAIVVG